MNSSPSTDVSILGELIHNPQVINKLSSAGIHTLTAIEDIQQYKNSDTSVIISSSGSPPEAFDAVQEAGLNLINATCPDVILVQDIVAMLDHEGYQVIILGDKDHSEVKGVFGYAGKSAKIISTSEEANGLQHYRKLGVVVQTTQTLKYLADMVGILAAKAMEIRVFNTICSATVHRQESVYDLCNDDIEVLIVVGGYNSANTKRLAAIGREANIPTYHIEDARELRKEWFEGVAVVGLTAGASTPDWVIEEVEYNITKLGGWDKQNG